MTNLRILYVDNSKVAYKRLLQVMDVVADLDWAATQNEAKAMLQEHRFDCFIIDQDLADGTGLELISHVRSLPEYSDVPIVLYSASLNNELAYQAMVLRCNDSFAKPMNLLELRERVIGLIEVPEIKHVRRELLQMTCFRWYAGGMYHEYSPDLDLHLTAKSAGQVADMMQERLEREILAKPDPENYPADVSVKKHIISLVDNRDQNAA